jgi:hypothetical protein
VSFWVWCATVALPALFFNEFSKLSPWMARQVVRIGAHLLLDRSQVERYEAEWLAGLDGVEGELTVLLKALGIVFIGVPRMNWDYFDCVWACTIGLHSFTSAAHSQLKWPSWLQRSAEQRLAAEQYNAALAMTFQMIRRGSPALRAEAFAAFEGLIERPPPWVADDPFNRWMLKWTIRRDTPHFRQSLRRRGLLAPRKDAK